MMRKSGFEPALPFLILEKDNREKRVVYANDRLVQLIRPMDGKLSTEEDLGQVWPFFDEFRSPAALFQYFMGEMQVEDEDTAPVYAEAFLKTFRIHAKQDGKYCLMVFEMVRSGDLLEDAEARQVLFRAMSHEIRTSIMALRGYTEILQDKMGNDSTVKMEVEGIKNSMLRLDRVVRRLDDFKTEMKVLNAGGDEDEVSSKKSKKNQKKAS